MESIEQSEKNPQINDGMAIDDAAAKAAPCSCLPDKDTKKKLLESVVSHITEFFKKFSNADGSLRNPENQELIDMGRDEEERQQIEEFCQDLDEQNKLMDELQAFKAEDPNNTAQKWLELNGEKTLRDCTPEEKEEILMYVHEQQDTEIQAQADALKDTAIAKEEESVNKEKETEDE